MTVQSALRLACVRASSPLQAEVWLHGRTCSRPVMFPLLHAAYLRLVATYSCLNVLAAFLLHQRYRRAFEQAAAGHYLRRLRRRLRAFVRSIVASPGMSALQRCCDPA